MYLTCLIHFWIHFFSVLYSTCIRHVFYMYSLLCLIHSKYMSNTSNTNTCTTTHPNLTHPNLGEGWSHRPFDQWAAGALPPSLHQMTQLVGTPLSPRLSSVCGYLHTYPWCAHTSSLGASSVGASSWNSWGDGWYPGHVDSSLSPWTLCNLHSSAPLDCLHIGAARERKGSDSQLRIHCVSDAYSMCIRNVFGVYFEYIPNVFARIVNLVFKNVFRCVSKVFWLYLYRARRLRLLAAWQDRNQGQNVFRKCIKDVLENDRIQNVLVKCISMYLNVFVFFPNTCQIQ